MLNFLENEENEIGYYLPIISVKNLGYINLAKLFYSFGPLWVDGEKYWAKKYESLIGPKMVRKCGITIPHFLFLPWMASPSGAIHVQYTKAGERGVQKALRKVIYVKYQINTKSKTRIFSIKPMITLNSIIDFR